jgi:hypothetical protein
MFGVKMISDSLDIHKVMHYRHVTHLLFVRKLYLMLAANDMNHLYLYNLHSYRQKRK